MPFDYAVAQYIEGTPYQVTLQLASGGMGAVYEVVDTSIGKRFALKTLKAALKGDEVTEQRMTQEAKILGRLTHQNVVQVFTAGVTHDHLRLPFIVMERLFGFTLREIIRTRRGGLDLRAATLITLDLLAALDDAHDLGLVHRDIKPENVFLHRLRRGGPVTKLLDFGLAELVATMKDDESCVFSGTVRYASPEQLAGIALSQKSDLYSVGLVVHEMLTGHYLFPNAITVDDIVMAHVREVPIIPRSWPSTVRELVGSVLEKVPEKRPRDAFTFAAKLRNAVRALGVNLEDPLREEELVGAAGAATVQASHDTEIDPASTELNATRPVASTVDTAPVVEDTAPNSRPLWRG